MKAGLFYQIYKPINQNRNFSSKLNTNVSCARADCLDKSDEAGCSPACNFDSGKLCAGWTMEKGAKRYDWLIAGGSTATEQTGKPLPLQAMTTTKLIF